MMNRVRRLLHCRWQNLPLGFVEFADQPNTDMFGLRLDYLPDTGILATGTGLTIRPGMPVGDGQGPVRVVQIAMQKCAACPGCLLLRVASPGG